MPDLLSCEHDIAASLRDARESGRAVRWLLGDAALNERRLAVYRGNAAAATAKALGAAYPVTEQVLGRSAFAILARDYQRLAPSTSGDLNELGAELADIVAAHEMGQSLPYLADLARLEWAAHRAYGAADASPFDTRAIAQLSGPQQSTIRFVWAAGTTLIRSQFPIVRIWRIHQAGFDGEFSVDWSNGEVALIAREGLRVAVHALDGCDAVFIAASLAGEPVGAAAQRALANDTGFDLGRLLTWLITSNVICGFTSEWES
jgi:hypothetical protein